MPRKEIMPTDKKKRATLKDIIQHYNLPVEWFRWANILFGYSCAMPNWNTLTYKQAVINKLKFFIKKMKIEKGQRGFEFGAGHYHAADYISKNTGAEITALNIVPQEVDYGKTLAKKNKLLKVKKQDLHDFEETGFDFGYADGCLVHQERKQLKFFKAIFRALRPGGIAIIKEMVMFNIDDVSRKECELIKETFMVGEYQEHEVVRATIKKSGLVILEEVEIPIWCYLWCLKEWVKAYRKNKKKLKKINKDRYRLDRHTYENRFPPLLERGAFKVVMFICQRP